MERYGIMLNEDSTHFLGSRADVCEKLERSDLERFIDQYKDTEVTDLMMCVTSAVPSKYFTFFGDQYLVTEELGRPVNYRDVKFMKAAHTIWYEKKLDLYEIWISQCRKDGIRPWLSFRMNDAHYLLLAPYPGLSQFFYDHLHSHSRVRHRRQFQHWDRCRDYGIAEVRAQHLHFISEMLDRYDAYGIELDFLREMDCFQIGWESRGLEQMTGFMEDVKREVRRAEEKWGHEMKICVRCNAEPRYCREFGFDVVEWAKRGLFDVLVPSGRWGTTDNDIPIWLWKQILEPYGIELAGGLEIQVSGNPGFQANGSLLMNTLETAAGSASYLFSQGADKLYLYNYMDVPNQMTLGDNRLPTDRTAPVNEGRVYYKLLTTLGTPEGAVAASRRHVVAYQDHNPPWRTNNAQLPLDVRDPDEPKFLRIVTGKILAEQTVTLKLGIASQIDARNDLELYVNSAPAPFVGTQESVEPPMTNSEIYCFHVDNEGNLPGEQIVELHYKGKPLTVDYAEVAVK